MLSLRATMKDLPETCNATYYVSRLCTECRCDEEVWETIRQHQYQRESARRVLQPGYNRPDTRATTLLHVTARKAYPVPVTKQVLLCTSLALYPSAVHSI